MDMDFLTKEITKTSIVNWQYSNLDNVLDNNLPHNHFDAIITYNIKEKWVLVQILRYGMQGDKDLPEIIQLDISLFITNLNELDKWFILSSPIENQLYELLKKDLSRDVFKNLEGRSDF